MLARRGGTSRKAEKPPDCSKPNAGACPGDSRKYQQLKSRGIVLAAKVCPPPAPGVWWRHLGHILLYPCQVSHPLVGDTSAPPRDPLSCSPGSGEPSPLSSPAGSQASRIR